MKYGKNGLVTLAAGAMAAMVCAPAAQSQSADAIIDKLVAKGVLTEAEGKELRQESDKDFRAAYQAKSGMPDWVTSLKINGDLRGRVEGFYFDNPDPSNRMRYRYRLRAGVVAVMKDRFEAGFRLMSSEPVDASSGGDPIGGNTTFNNNASKKFVYLDLAYGKWNFLKTSQFSDTVTVGKMENPFVFSDMIFDSDYTPEGIANALTYTLNDDHSLKLNAGGFVLDEIGSSSKDPWMYGAQLRWDASWTKEISTFLGVAGMAIEQEEFLTSGDVPNINSGNTRSAGGVLLEYYNPIIGDAAVTYTFESFPLYPTSFPIKVYTEYMYNPATDDQNVGWMAGISFGKSGKKRTWALDYRYKYLEADAWWEELVDSDFGTYRFTSPNGRAGYLNTPGSSRAYSSGTNVKGHVVRATYSPADALTFGVSFFRTENIRNFGLSEDGTGRLQVDAVWKF